ncbi:BA14K family protein [Daeguia caeni]|uniref:Lectin-like protein BA14k n=1 Tax=Daeguia caeni TaxID=439612 RepID=A0ABV9H943_9HYPH
MLIMLKKMMVGLVSVSFLAGAVAPTMAAPMVRPAISTDNANLELVQERWRRPPPRPGWGPGPGMRPRPPMGPGPAWRPGPRPRPGYWNGHRGYRYYRPGYRRGHDGWWYPLAAFGLGAAIGGMLAAPPPPPPAYRVHSRHEAWCYNRYRSYRASDNTYQPNRGPRKQCISPYSR